MDGFLPIETGWRRTLKAPIGCAGVALHTGRRVAMTLRPAEGGSGIVFRRTDLGLDIPARFDHVAETRLNTTLAHPASPAARVATVEHLLAAFVAARIDDALVELDQPEVPILDGSAEPFLFLLDCAGTTSVPMPRGAIEILKPVRVQEGEGPDAAWVMLSPAALPGLEAALTIDFASPAIGRQSHALRLTPEAIRQQLAPARTFTLAEDVARLRAAGLARGGSLANALVVDGPLVLNPGGLRMDGEFVRHKLLDAAGDLSLAGAPLRGRFTGYRSGHALNNRLLRALFADADAWRFAEAPAALGIAREAVAA